MQERNDEDFISLLRREVKPALGCTEPMAVALAVACASERVREYGDTPVYIKVSISSNILKNGMGVGIPGTTMVGLHVASAVAVECGRSELGLEVIRYVNDEVVERARKLLERKAIEVTLAETDKKLYIKATAISQSHTATVLIEDKHDNIALVEVDGTVELDKRTVNEEYELCEEFMPSVRDIFNFATTVDIEKVDFILESVKLNRAIAVEGLNGKYGLQVGRTIYEKMGSDIFGNGLLSYAMSLTAAASDARMAGSTMTVMSNSGSGNQGITATLPVVAAAEKYGSNREELVRALTLSHLVAIHIKQNLGRLSALCGCVVAATGSACGIVLLKGGGYINVAYAIKNMVGNITGMVCDGAKVGCALKVASGVSAAVQSAVLALNNLGATSSDGIIDDDLEKTLKNLSKIGCEGMNYTDKLMLEIMVSKS
ncbi:MAG: L-serine ammonia-lyase, iron-sulfur-dependent, subunit alpha [Rikenellaceae bacterium]